MKTPDALFLTAVAIVLTLLVAWASHRGKATRSGYCPGPHNIGLYDKPYNYPTYEGRGATAWDGDRHCAANCQQSPCVVWCR